jgi:hypothetical protein
MLPGHGSSLATGMDGPRLGRMRVVWPRPFRWGDLPIALGELLRSGLSGVVEEVIAAVRAEVPEYDQPLEGEFGTLISWGVTVALEQFVGLLGRDEDVPDLATSAGLGRAEHRAGRTLDALQSAYRVRARVAWRAMAQAGAAEGVESTTMYRLAEAIFAYVDRLAAASVAGFAEAEAMHAGALQARRHALLELLASATLPDRAEVARRAEAAGLSVPPSQVAALAVGSTDPAQLARRMPSGSIGAALDRARGTVPSPLFRGPLDAHGDVSAVAKMLQVHRQTVHYRPQRPTRCTGRGCPG